MTHTTIRPRRSLLFVPGLRPDRFDKALDTGADIVCVDIEDAVPLPRKQEARDLTLPLFANDAPAGVETMVRVNPLSTPDGLQDILALRDCASPPRALMLAKPGSAAEVKLYFGVRLGVISLLTRYDERAAGVPAARSASTRRGCGSIIVKRTHTIVFT